jgi:saccharopine dehydrogenase (NAD+, L-lysine-forming)
MSNFKKKYIFIRKETYENEFRTPIIPKDVTSLIKNNFTVFIESSKIRCYCDEEYIKYGATIVYNDWTNYNDHLIIGIKELEKIDLLNNHTHIYFSHSYKKQINSQYILQKFKESNSILYDLEYFILNNERLIAFGFYAGIVGCALGIIQYFSKIEKIKYWLSINDLINSVQKTNFNPIKIALIGYGKCGKGVQYLLNKLELSCDIFNKNSIKNNLENYDIIFNCINLTEDIGKWFDYNTNFYKKIVIVDISCDYTSDFNPIKIYNKKTTWNEPVFYYNELVHIIAIDNLPSLLPFESSSEFSEKLINILENYKKDTYKYWINNYNKYYEMIYN